MKWTIKNMKRTIDDGLVVEVVFEIIAKDQQLIASKRDKVTLVGDPSSPDFIPFENLTEEIVISWVKSEVDVVALEGEVQTILDGKIAKKNAMTTKGGLPWQKPFGF
jgi:hypothetical protein